MVRHSVILRPAASLRSQSTPRPKITPRTGPPGCPTPMTHPIHAATRTRSSPSWPPHARASSWPPSSLARRRALTAVQHHRVPPSNFPKKSRDLTNATGAPVAMPCRARTPPSPLFCIPAISSRRSKSRGTGSRWTGSSRISRRSTWNQI
jgi:hypothetical protein